MTGKSPAGGKGEDRKATAENSLETPQATTISTTPIQIKPDVLKSLLSESLHKLAFKPRQNNKNVSLSNLKTTSIDDKKLQYIQTVQGNPGETYNVDYNARLQLQHRKESTSSHLSSTQSSPNAFKFNQRKNQNIVEKSNQSAFTIVSPSRLGTQPLIIPSFRTIPSIVNKNLSFSSSCTITRPVTPLTTCVNTRHPLFTTVQSNISLSPQNFNQSVDCKSSTQTRTFSSENFVTIDNNSHKLNDVNNTSKQIQDLISISNSTKNSDFQYDNIDYLSDIQEESSILSMDSLKDVTVTTVSTMSQRQLDAKATTSAINTGTQTSQQTLLLALPQNVNIQQFSNQTLNLDYSSQQLLHSLLQLSTQTETDTSTSIKTSNSLIEENVLDDSHGLVIDVPCEENVPVVSSISLSSVIESNTTQNTTFTQSIEIPLNSFNTTISTTTTATTTNKTKGFHLQTIENQQLQQHEQQQQNEQQQPTQDNTQLPTAAINVDMIDGQPVYTIQLNGLSIPIAAITIPTSDGPRHLQSAITCLPQSATAKVSSDQPSDSESLSIYQEKSSISTAISTSESPVSSIQSKTKYTCEICGKSYIRPWCYYGHLREHAGDVKEHKCMICGKSFNSVNGLKGHLLTHSEEKDYLCTICDKHFSNSSSLRVHQLAHATEKAFKCKATGCDKAFPNASALRIHQRVHQEEKPYKCNHAGCDKAFKTPSELSRHEFRHTGEKPYKCDKCEKSFVRNDDLKRHSFIHTGQKRFKCDQCDFSCIQSFDLVKHKYIHGGEKPYKCKICPKQFTRPARLREHERLHTGERPYKCEECGKSFTQLTSLKSHKVTHGSAKVKQSLSDLKDDGNKRFHCMLCNKEFVSEKTLKRHAVVHSGEKPFECRVCQKRFARASDLKVHSPVHHEDKPFKCEQCPKSFTRFSSLKEHIRLHTGEFPFKCDICDKIFNHRSHLNVHLRSHTGERPHKCHICPKEFSRKTSLRHHLRTHCGITDSTSTTMTAPVIPTEVEVMEDEDSNFSDNSFMDGQQSIQLDQANLQFWKTLQTVLKPVKRKRNDSDDETEEDESGLLHKRLITDAQLTTYPSSEQILSDITRSEISQLQGAGVTVVDASNVGNFVNTDNQVIFHQLPPGQHLTQSHYLNPDGTTVVALSLAEATEGEVVESLVEIHGLDGIQGLDTQSLIEQQQHPMNQHMQQEITGDLHMENLTMTHADHAILHDGGTDTEMMTDIQTISHPHLNNRGTN